MSDTLQNRLFARYELLAILEQQLQTVDCRVAEMPLNQFLSTNLGTLIEQMVGDLLIEPLVLHDGQMRKDSSPIEISMAGQSDYGRIIASGVTRSGRRLRYVIPFTGHVELWQTQASFRSTGYVLGEVGSVQRT